MKNIYLIGMMGSGKTTTGRALAQMLQMPFIDLDDLIVEKSGKTINELFASEGEPYFRDLESKLLAEVVKKENQIIATGGGAVINAKNAELLKQTGLIIYLKTGFPVLWERVKTKKDRPLLKNQDPQKTLAELLEKRAPIYESLTKMTFQTDGKTPEAVAQDIFNARFKTK